MTVVVNEFEVVPAPSAATGPGTAGPQAPPEPRGQGPWAALEVAEGQRRLAERAERLEAC